MSKIGMVAALVLVMLAGSVWAIDDIPENRSKEADRYMAATPPKEMFQDAAEQMAKNLPVKQRREFKNLMTKHLDIPALEKTMKEGMIKHLTADELKALADFYGSPVGKSAMKKFGVYMAEVMPSIQAEIMKALAKANRELSEDTEKK
jgi:hypothetical protein